MLYVVLIAMLAINISEEVLGGFKTAKDDFEGNIEKQKALNESLIGKLKDTDMEAAALELKNSATDAAKDFEDIRNSINNAISNEFFSTKTANDGDLSSVKEIMLNEKNPKVEIVKAHMDKIREMCLELAKEDAVKEVIDHMLSTADEKGDWGERHFSEVPVIGADMMLKKTENEIWTAANLAIANAMEGVVTDSISGNNRDEASTDKKIHDKIAAEIANKLYSQNMKIAENKDGQQTLVMTEHKAPLFAGFENIVKVMTFSNGNTQNDIKVYADNGTVRKENGEYVVIPDANAEELTLKVTSGKKTMAEYSYNVIPLPMPKPVLVYSSQNGETREYIAEVPLTKKELLSIREVKLAFTGNVDTKETVTEFDIMVIKGKNKETMIEHVKGNTVNNNMKWLLDKVEKGDKLIFTNIKAKGKFTKERMLVSINVANM